MIFPLVTVIVPCRDEVRYIDACLASIAATTYPRELLEVLVVDGMSEDGTRAHIAAARDHDPRLTLIDNPARTAPAALNLGIARARGSVIMRMDAHCEYAPDYIPTLVRALDERQADNVGGVTEVLPASGGAIARGIAVALAHPAGVGNSYFRIGAREPRWVDTVPFGCWRRELFTKVGLFDESLPRNQDDEFNLRLARHGGRILLLPDVRTRYYARESLPQLARMFYQYGYYKPLSVQRSSSRFRARQLAPAALVVALGVGLVLSPFSPIGGVLFTLAAGSYLLFVIGAAALVAAQRGPAAAVGFAAALPTMHLAYGLGFLRGALRFTIFRRAPAPATPQLSR